MEFSGIDDELRKRFNIKDSVKGVVVTKRRSELARPPTSASQAGDVIVEVKQEPVTTPDDMIARSTR